MSRRQQALLLVPPLFPGECSEEREVFRGFPCGYCKGNGWFWGADRRRESVKRDCPVCQGTGRLRAEVTVRWVPEKKGE